MRATHINFRWLLEEAAQSQMLMLWYRADTGAGGSLLDFSATGANATLGPAIGVWGPSNNYAINNAVRPTAGYDGDTYYKVTTDAGSSGGSEPTWPTTHGDTVVDGGITWTCQKVSSLVWGTPGYMTLGGSGNVPQMRNNDQLLAPTLVNLLKTSTTGETAYNASTLTLSASGKTITDSAAAIPNTAAFQPGKWLAIRGFTGVLSNNIDARIATRTNSILTFDDQTAFAADDAAGESVTLTPANPPASFVFNFWLTRTQSMTGTPLLFRLADSTNAPFDGLYLQMTTSNYLFLRYINGWGTILDADPLCFVSANTPRHMVFIFDRWAKRITVWRSGQIIYMRNYGYQGQSMCDPAAATTPLVVGQVVNPILLRDFQLYTYRGPLPAQWYTGEFVNTLATQGAL